MSFKHILTVARRPRKPPSLFQPHRFSSSSSPAVNAHDSFYNPSPPDYMIFGRLAPENQKPKSLDYPDPRYRRYSPSDPTFANILSTPKTRVTKLPNGLRVATESNPAAETATLGVWIDAGSRFETEEMNGTAHFLKRMVFKGTEKRSVSELEEEIEIMGGNSNGDMSREHTAYYAKVSSRDVNNVMGIFADILQNSKFEEDQIESERNVILREIEEVENREEVIFDHLHATAFQDTPLSRTILGPAENIKKITKADLQNYIQTHYSAPRMVVSAAGDVKHEDVVDLVKGLFTKLSTDPTTASQLVKKEPAGFTGSEVRIVDDNVPLAQFAVAFKGSSWTDSDSIALMVMQSMLGSWNKNNGGENQMGSELAQRIGTNEIAESFMAFNTYYKDTGLFGVYASAKPDCLKDLAYAIMNEVTKLSYRVSEEDVIRARDQLKSSLLLHIDATSPVAEDIGRQLLAYGRRIPFVELFARIDAVDKNTVKRVANRFLFDQDIAIAAMGPIQTLPDYNQLRRRTCLLRY